MTAASAGQGPFLDLGASDRLLFCAQSWDPYGRSGSTAGPPALDRLVRNLPLAAAALTARSPVAGPGHKLPLTDGTFPSHKPAHGEQSDSERNSVKFAYGHAKRAPSLY